MWLGRYYDSSGNEGTYMSKLNKGDSRLGETRKNNKGLLMTIIGYRNCRDIDVQFEDGYITTNRKYNSFLSGSIARPTIRVGETAMAKNGMKMTIIAFRNYRDLDIQFEDGYIVTGITYPHFISGSVKNPNVSNSYWHKQSPDVFHVGETNINTQGLSMTIIAYRYNDDIDVQFEDGSIREHKSYYAFKQGKIRNVNAVSVTTAKENVGESNTALNGQTMKIIAWRGFHDIDVQFEDGTIVTQKRYDHFKHGYIVNPNCSNKTPDPKNRVGQTNKAKNGLMMTIETYRSATDLDVRFENGTLVQHRAYKEFMSGSIGCPGYGRYADKMSKYLGKQMMASNGQLMEIIGGTDAKNLIVRFEDGTEVKGITTSVFNSGHVVNPNYTYRDVERNSYLGKTNVANNGLKMTIVAFRSSSDIDVQFEDGVKVCHKKLHHFNSGDIKHPQIVSGVKSDRVGETNISVCGLNMEILSYPRATDVTIKFETGYVAEHKIYHNFLTGKIGHPLPYTIGDITMTKLAYTYNGVGNFFCHCNKCGIEDIFTVEEIKNHKC